MVFLILSVIIFNLIAIFIPKRISGIEILTTTLFSSFLELIANILWDLKYDLYGYFNKGVDFKGFIFVFGIYPAINIVFLNFFPFKKNMIRKVIYISCWSLFANIYELLFLWSKTFYYNGWKFWYSIIIYPILYIILIGFYQYVSYLLRRNQQ
ncbi:CBO0543 family protein [Neobacillus ginsengisoli]|uniref:Rod shape-determining protein MreD n=1 Tax=Neobacillus ginsengisoli TaxID=904295 RepID=A0ABT9Y2Q3_9BACI|nr:CBO0543 family protein [Neobacillus ginsengisoli]MDQ0201856.1 hypothetical protein [Neobacillus ginsengisoli]